MSLRLQAGGEIQWQRFQLSGSKVTLHVLRRLAASLGCSGPGPPRGLLSSVSAVSHLLRGGSRGLGYISATRGMIWGSQRLLSPRGGASGDPEESRWRREAREGCLAFRAHGTVGKARRGGGAAENGRRSSGGNPGPGTVKEHGLWEQVPLTTRDLGLLSPFGLHLCF